MAFRSIGDLSSSMQMRYLNAELKSRIGQLGVELTTGKVTDVSKRLGGGLDQLGSVNRSLKLLDSYRIAASELTARGSGLQTALNEVQTAIDSRGVKAIAAANSLTDTAIDAAALSASAGFEKSVGALNAQIGGRSLFSGQAFQSRAIKPASDILDDLQVLAVGATTSSQVDIIVDDYFTSVGGGFESSAYQGSNTPLGEVRISETESTGFGVSATRTELREALAGLAKAALLTRNVLAGDIEARSEVLTAAGETMISATDGIVTMRSEIGSVEQRLGLVEVSNSARGFALEITLTDMVSADGYTTATRLQAAEASLEALYISTTRISQLSLTRYLR